MALVGSCLVGSPMLTSPRPEQGYYYLRAIVSVFPRHDYRPDVRVGGGWRVGEGTGLKICVDFKEKCHSRGGCWFHSLGHRG